MIPLEKQLELTFKQDNGVWSNFYFGHYAVDGKFRNDYYGEYYLSDGVETPVLEVSLESDAVVQRVQVLTRFKKNLSGWKIWKPDVN